MFRAALVFPADGNACVAHAAGERLEAQGGPFCSPSFGDEPTTAFEIVEIAADYARIEDRITVIENENGHFAKRIDRKHILVAIDGARPPPERDLQYLGGSGVTRQSRFEQGSLSGFQTTPRVNERKFRSFE